MEERERELAGRARTDATWARHMPTVRLLRNKSVKISHNSGNSGRGVQLHRRLHVTALAAGRLTPPARPRWELLFFCSPHAERCTHLLLPVFRRNEALERVAGQWHRLS